jgi:hypothetical protein
MLVDLLRWIVPRLRRSTPRERFLTERAVEQLAEAMDEAHDGVSDETPGSRGR